MDRPAQRWTGAGYLDMNWGAEPIEAAFPRWDWSRASLGAGRSAILYDATLMDGGQLSLGLRFDAVNSNTFQDPSGQSLSYKFGSLMHVDAEVRALAIAHNVDCIRVGEQLGSTALTVWIGDGTNFPGQQDFTAGFERYLESLARIYAALPPNWSMYLEHKLYEPAFYSTVNQDWGSSLMAAQATGERCRCLVDLGHHAPTVNIEMIVARLIQFNKLGGFHFNDSKYGDDDLDSGSVDPFRLFLDVMLLRCPVNKKIAVVISRLSREIKPANPFRDNLPEIRSLAVRNRDHQTEKYD